MLDFLPVLDQLAVQLGKCKSIHKIYYHKSQQKTAKDYNKIK